MAACCMRRRRTGRFTAGPTNGGSSFAEPCWITTRPWGGRIYEGAPRVSILVERPQEPRSSRERGSGAEERGQREKGRERDQANQQTSTNQAIKPTKQRREGRETRGVGRA